MPPRAMWTGQLRISLVSFGVRLYAATESAKRVSMNQLHKDCNQRVKNQTTCPVHGPIPRDEIVKGYEYQKDSYVIIDAEDIEGIKLKSTKTIEIVQFVDADEIDPLYVNAPYYLGPDGPVAEGAYRVIHEAMERTGRVGIGKHVMQGRESIVAVRPSGKGFLLTTLRYPEEVRSGDQFFSEIAEGEVDEEQVTLAKTIMDGKTEPFDPSQFHDLYKEAFFQIVQAKIEGQAPVIVEEEEMPASFNFMDALKESVAAIDTGAASKPAAKKKTKKSAAKKKTTTKKAAAKSVRKKPPAKSVSARKKQTKQPKRA